jgi:hypothetical protein
MTAPALSLHRHPELVSGSIERFVRSLRKKRDGWVSLPNMARAREEKWTLKQVQGDEEASWA